MPFPDCSNYPGLGNYRGEGLECCLICDLAAWGSSITSEERAGRGGAAGRKRPRFARVPGGGLYLPGVGLTLLGFPVKRRDLCPLRLAAPRAIPLVVVRGEAAG